MDRTGGQGAAKERYILIEGNRRVAAVRLLAKEWIARVAAIEESNKALGAAIWKREKKRRGSVDEFPLAKLACCVFEGKVDDARNLSIQVHVNRDVPDGTNRGDEAVAVQWLLKGLKPKQIEDMLGDSQAWVSLLKGLAERLSPKSMEDLRNGVISMVAANKLVKKTRVRKTFDFTRPAAKPE